MHCRDITESEFEAISAELTGTTSQADGIETVTGRHEEYGFTVLVRDASRCMALLEDASVFDVFRPAADLPKAGSSGPLQAPLRRRSAV